MDLLPPKNSTNYYKGNLHGHSNHSDGALKPKEVVNEYKKLGYDFTCLSSSVSGCLISSKETSLANLISSGVL